MQGALGGSKGAQATRKGRGLRGVRGSAKKPKGQKAQKVQGGTAGQAARNRRVQVTGAQQSPGAQAPERPALFVVKGLGFRVFTLLRGPVLVRRKPAHRPPGCRRRASDLGRPAP